MKEEFKKRIGRFWEHKKWPQRLVDGKRQIDLLVLFGLKPHHFILDVGCGWLRGGIYLIDYLDEGHYYGFDKEEKQLIRGEVLLEGKELGYKNPRIELIHRGKDLALFVGTRRFDYMLANSVFTHIDPYMADRLFSSVIPFLEDKGLFLASFYKSDLDAPKIGRLHWSRSNEYGRVTYPFQFFVDLAKKYELSVNYLPDDPDKHGQNWMYFYRKEFVDERWGKV
jgi:hypothetical protein